MAPHFSGNRASSRTTNGKVPRAQWTGYPGQRWEPGRDWTPSLRAFSLCVSGAEERLRHWPDEWAPAKQPPRLAAGSVAESGQGSLVRFCSRGPGTGQTSGLQRPGGVEHVQSAVLPATGIPISFSLRPGSHVFFPVSPFQSIPGDRLGQSSGSDRKEWTVGAGKRERMGSTAVPGNVLHRLFPQYAPKFLRLGATELISPASRTFRSDAEGRGAQIPSPGGALCGDASSDPCGSRLWSEGDAVSRLRTRLS